MLKVIGNGAVWINMAWPLTKYASRSKAGQNKVGTDSKVIHGHYSWGVFVLVPSEFKWGAGWYWQDCAWSIWWDGKAFYMPQRQFSYVAELWALQWDFVGLVGMVQDGCTSGKQSATLCLMESHSCNITFCCCCCSLQWGSLGRNTLGAEQHDSKSFHCHPAHWWKKYSLQMCIQIYLVQIYVWKYTTLGPWMVSGLFPDTWKWFPRNPEIWGSQIPPPATLFLGIYVIQALGISLPCWFLIDSVHLNSFYWFCYNIFFLPIVFSSICFLQCIPHCFWFSGGTVTQILWLYICWPCRCSHIQFGMDRSLIWHWVVHLLYQAYYIVLHFCQDYLELNCLGLLVLSSLRSLLPDSSACFCIFGYLLPWRKNGILPSIARNVGRL